MTNGCIRGGVTSALLAPDVPRAPRGIPSIQGRRHAHHRKVRHVDLRPGMVVLGCAVSVVVGVLAAGAARLAAAAQAAKGVDGWRVVSSPNPGPTTNELNGVACTSTTNCVAVGISGSTLPYNRTLAESWNGSSWSVVPIPSTAATDADKLNGVACAGSSFCAAVGYVTTNGFTGNPKTLIELWNGSSWSIVPSPNPGSGQPTQRRVLPERDDVLRRRLRGRGERARPVVGRGIDGSTWSVDPSQTIDSGGLRSIWCGGPSECKAGGGGEAPSLLSWDGTSWTATATPAPVNRSARRSPPSRAPARHSAWPGASGPRASAASRRNSSKKDWT